MTVSRTLGRLRLDSDADGYYPDLQPGDYFLYNGAWLGMTPNGLLANFGGHTVQQHADGTITVDPSIKTENGEGGLTWHGYLKRGMWEECKE